MLLLLLGVQWVYFNRASLAAQNDWRPGLELFCSFLRCELPLRVDLFRIELVSRDVRKHPRISGALLINATLVNRADFPSLIRFLKSPFRIPLEHPSRRAVSVPANTSVISPISRRACR